MAHTVFINDHPLHFVDLYKRNDLITADGEIFSENELRMDQLIELMEGKDAPAAAYYLSANTDVSRSEMISHCKLIETAGGLVQSEENRYLFIFRRGKWDLPKGKIEYDESIEEAAVREVGEETGIQRLTIVKKLPSTFHTYWDKNQRMLKKNNWLFLHCQDAASQTLIAQSEEDIREVRWMNDEEIQSIVFKNTHNSIAHLLKLYQEGN